MEKSFSQRLDITPVRTVFQTESMDDALRNSLWNVVEMCVWEKAMTGALQHTANRPILAYVRCLWSEFFKYTLDTIPRRVVSVHDQVKNEYFSFEWFRVYDFMEFTGANAPISPGFKRLFSVRCNKVMESEMSGFRFIEGKIAPMTDEVEIAAIESAASDSWGPVSTHIRRSVALLSERPTPDFRNSVKEAISAVESACKIVSKDDKADLSKAIKIIEKVHPIHPAFKEALIKLYAYSSDDDGIRHAIMKEPNVGLAEAKFMLVACSAFCNFLKLRVSELGQTDSG